MILASNINEPGMARIAFANTDMLSGETLARIEFDLLADGISSLRLKTMEFYGTNALLLSSKCMGKGFNSWKIPPEHSALLQNFPNPFNPETWIPYQLKEGSEVTIRVYSATGDLIRELEFGYKPAGLYTSRDRAAYWDGRNRFGLPVASGVYFYNIQAGDFTAVRKLTILR